MDPEGNILKIKENVGKTAKTFAEAIVKGFKDSAIHADAKKAIGLKATDMSPLIEKIWEQNALAVRDVK